MLLDEDELKRRLSSPVNLINRLRRGGSISNGAMNIFGMSKSSNGNGNGEVKQNQSVAPKFVNPFEKAKTNQVEALTITEVKPNEITVPITDDLIDNAETQINLASAHDTALTVLGKALKRLDEEIPNMSGKAVVPAIAAANKVVESIRKERNEAAKQGKGKEVHYHFYTPIQRKSDEFETIEVS